MKELTNAEFIEQALRDKNSNFKIAQQSNWMIERIEMLLNCYPILQKFNCNAMGLDDFDKIIASLFEYLEMQYEEDGDVVFVDFTAESTELRSLMSLKEMILWVLLASLNNKSHVHFKYNKKTFDAMKVSESKAIDCLCDNSYLTINNSTDEYHFLLSITSVLSFDYKKHDSIMNTIASIKTNHNKNLTLTTYIKNRGTGQNIDIKPKLQKQSKSMKIKI